MELPRKYIEMVENLFEDEGKKWLNNLDKIIDKNSIKYELSDLNLVNNLTYNLVMNAKSKNYGEVIVKIGLPNKEAIYEINALKVFNGEYACKCYECNLDNYFYILERLKPGTDLLKIDNKDERIKIFCELVNKLPKKYDGIIELPKHRDTLDSAFLLAEKNKDDYKEIIDLIKIADEEYKKIEKLNLEKYVLHGDLHHTNILLNNNEYKVIDPHGVIGEKILEVGCFILNELWIYGSEKEDIKNVLEKVAKNMKKEINEIARATFIRSVLSTAWSVEEKDWKTVKLNNVICREILKYI